MPHRSSGRDETATRHFIEAFALALTAAGMQRTGARVFAALLSSETASLTAREVAETVQVSPAAVSGAVRYLENVGLTTRRRHPGSRVDHFELRGDFWYESMANKSDFYETAHTALSDGIKAVGPDSAAGERLEETRDFFGYMAERVPQLLEEWRAARREQA